jgi:hypothetical protein
MDSFDFSGVYNDNGVHICATAPINTVGNKRVVRDKDRIRFIRKKVQVMALSM